MKRLASAPFILLLALLVICVAADEDSYAPPKPPGVLKRTWHKFCAWPFGYQFLTILVVSTLLAKLLFY